MLDVPLARSASWPVLYCTGREISRDRFQSGDSLGSPFHLIILFYAIVEKREIMSDTKEYEVTRTTERSPH